MIIIIVYEILRDNIEDKGICQFSTNGVDTLHGTVAETITGNITSMFPIDFYLSVSHFLHARVYYIENDRDDNHGNKGSYRFVVIVNNIVSIVTTAGFGPSITRYIYINSIHRRDYPK